MAGTSAHPRTRPEPRGSHGRVAARPSAEGVFTVPLPGRHMTDDSTGGPAGGASGSDDPEPVPDAATGNHWKQLVLEME